MAQHTPFSSLQTVDRLILCRAAAAYFFFFVGFLYLLCSSSKTSAFEYIYVGAAAADCLTRHNRKRAEVSLSLLPVSLSIWRKKNLVSDVKRVKRVDEAINRRRALRETLVRAVYKYTHTE